MKKITSLALTALLGFTLLTATATAGSIEKGQNYYTKKIKGQCADKTGAAFAATYTQAQWAATLKDGKFEATVKTMCPDLKKYKEKWTPHLFEFANEYASDTGNEPAC
ncbi:MAG: cytochrome C [Sulfurovum sp.]|nr:cytochrome C [Sulfurovum sp.]